MREITLEEQKEILKEILNAFHEFCGEHKLQYYLTGGTLLGAVRHRGFIPWDDDIDVCMPRNDYEKFLDLFDSAGKRFKVVSIRNKDYYLPFAKIVDTTTRLVEMVDSEFELGIYIDVFPIDNMSNDYQKAFELYKSVTKYRNALMIKNIKLSKRRALYKNFMLLSGKTLLYIVPRKWILKKIDEKSQIYRANDATAYVGMVCAAFYGKREILKDEWFTERCLLEFEGGRFWAPKGYDAFLTQLYGDYMQLPPEEKRVTHHDNKAWLVED